MKRVIILIVILSMIMVGIAVAEEDLDLSDYDSFKVFVVVDGEAFSDYNITTFRYANVDVHVEKLEGENYFTVYHKNRGEFKIFINPKGAKELAITNFHFMLTGSTGNALGVPEEDMIVSIDKPMFTLPVYQSNGDSIDEGDIGYFHAKVGKTGDDPWVYDLVNINSNGIICLQDLEPGEYWLGLESAKRIEINMPSRIVFTVNKDKTVEGLDEYIRYSAPSLNVIVKFKSGNDLYPYNATFNIFRKGSGSLSSTWLDAFSTKESKPAVFSNLTDGVYEYTLSVYRVVNGPKAVNYEGKLEIKDGVYNFNLPSYLPVEILTSEFDNESPEQVSTLLSNENIVLKEAQRILKYEDDIYFDDLNIRLLFPYRQGKKDEFITVRTIDRIKYGNELVDLKQDFQTNFVSDSFEILVTEHEDNDYDVCIPIDLSKVEEINNISVYGFSGQDKKWINLGGRINFEDHTMKVENGGYKIFAIGEGRPKFSDMDKTTWAIPAVNALASKGVVSGYGDNIFKPRNAIKKAEFLSLLIKLCALDGNRSQVFSDTENKWYQGIMSVAVDYELIQPIDNKVEPDKQISRAEMATILNNALNLYPDLTYIKDEMIFEDLEEISESSKDDILNVQRFGLMSGKGNGFFPLDTANRAEATQVIYNFLQLLEKQ